MTKPTVATALMKNAKFSRVQQVANVFDIGICCSKCAVERPEGPKGEYYLLGKPPLIADGIRFSLHKPCARDWILCKENNTNVWFRVRPMYGEITESIPEKGILCAYVQPDGPFVGKSCPSGDMCVDAHSEMEVSVWSLMLDVGLTYKDMRDMIIEEIGKYLSGSGNGLATNTMINNAGFDDEDDEDDEIEESPSPTVIPADAVRPGYDFEQQGFLLSATKKTYLIIRVTHVESPDLFYFQLYENNERMEKCWNDMKAFYESEDGEKYKMIGEDLLRNLPVAYCFWNEGVKMVQWRRAKIVDWNVGTSCLVKITDVDFGGVSTVDLENLRMLRGKYFAYHKQAMKGSVAFVRPSPGDEWSVEALEMTREFCKCVPLVAEVVGTTKCGEQLALMPCDTSSDPLTDTYLADKLVKFGHAEAFNSVKPFDFYSGGAIIPAPVEIIR